MKKKAVVIGAGIGGLASAALLARDGHDVTLVEKNNSTGGRARYWESEGYTFDMGPSWYLMPEVFDNFFSLFGENREDYYSLHRLDPAYRVFFSDHEVADVYSDVEKAAALFESFEPGGGGRLREYLKQAEYKYKVAMDEFLYRDYSSVFDFLNRKLIIEGSKMGVFGKLDRFVGKHFSDRRAKQLLEYTMVFLGTSPLKAPALYSIMSHLDLNVGVFYPDGGLAGVAQAFQKLAEAQGVKVVTSNPVHRIAVRNGKAEGLETEKGMIPADLVLSNADYAFTETHLLDERNRSIKSTKWDRKVWAPSMFLLYLGVSRKLKNLSHHNLYFTENWNDHFHQIFEKPDWPEKPCFYVSCISKTDSSSAPRKGENVFALVPVAPGLQDDEKTRESYADHLIKHIEDVTGEQISGSIDVKRIFSGRDFAADYNAYNGTALGLSHTLGQTAVFRPTLKSNKVENLYYAGQYTHPGVGVPMVIIAAQVAAQRIKEDVK